MNKITIKFNRDTEYFKNAKDSGVVEILNELAQGISNYSDGYNDYLPSHFEDEDGSVVATIKYEEE